MCVNLGLVGMVRYGFDYSIVLFILIINVVVNFFIGNSCNFLFLFILFLKIIIWNKYV